MTKKLSVVQLTDKEIKTNLLEWYHISSAEEKSQGARWYQDAHNYAKELAEKHTVPLESVAKVISHLSPQNKWEDNKRNAATMIVAWKDGRDIDSFTVSTFPNQKQKAWDTLNGIPVKFGPKTGSFFHNIYQQSSVHCTIDLWAIRSCLSTDILESGTYVPTVSTKNYARLERLHAELAQELEVHIYSLQAIIWVTIKRVYGR